MGRSPFLEAEDIFIESDSQIKVNIATKEDLLLFICAFWIFSHSEVV